MIRFAPILLAVLLLAAGAARDAADRWIDRTALPVVLAEMSVEIRDRNGQLLRPYQVADGLWRLAPGPVDAGFLNMLTRYEDRRFWQHSGVDVLALARALGQAIRYRRVVSGGSTLSMQVARLLEDGPTGSLSGKLRQIRVALALERRLGKSEILRLYLAHAPYGGNLEGIRAASLAWFGKEPSRLNAPESALLVALPQAPESRRPDRNPAAARAARDRVLRRMAASGALSPDELDWAIAEDVPTARRRFPALAAHLSDRVRRRMPDMRLHDLTIDAGIQARLEQLALQAVDGRDRRLSVAMLAADHGTGEILASVGSPRFAGGDGRQGYVDMTQATRSPGSTLKPLVYGLAFDLGLVHPETLIRDAPVQFGHYAPTNFDGQFRGDVRIRDALQMSLNTPVVQLTNEIGPARLMAALTGAGTDPRLPDGSAPGLAISLGGVGLSLQDLVQIYAALARGGNSIDLNHRLGESARPGRRLISDVAAWQIGDILAGLAPPPGARSRVLAYKTGTSYGHRDAWAVGYDGRHVIGVWIGRADGTPVPGAFGADLAAPLLFKAFARLKPRTDPLPPPPPATLIVGAADLPPPLQRFRPRDAAFDANPSAPKVRFPPAGARLDLAGAPIVVKLRGGQAPFSVLANGAPVVTGLRQREFEVPNPGRGFSTLVVLDSAGHSEQITIEID